MGILELQYTPAFQRDLKKLSKKHVDVSPLAEVLDLISENSNESIEVLRRRYQMHNLSGSWGDSKECHVGNAGDWLLIWKVFSNIALMQRTDSHDELFR